MENLKLTFALMVVVALAGIVLAGIQVAKADIPRFLTIKASETNNMTHIGHLCNENYGGAGYSCQSCKYRADDNGYNLNQMYCTYKAYEDCNAAYPSICYCNYEENQAECET